MLIKFTPKVDHLKVVTLTPKEGLVLTRNQVNLLPGTNEVTDDEWKAMRGNIQYELDEGEIKILAQKVGDGRGKPGGRKAKNLVDMPVNIAVKYVSECNNPDTLIKWYKEVTKEEVRLAITNKMKKLELELPEEEIPDAPNASPMSLDEFENDDEDFVEDEDETAETEDDEQEEDELDYSKMKLPELKKVCEDAGIDTSAFTKKADYLEALTQDNAVEE